MKRTKLEIASLSAILFATMCQGLHGQVTIDSVAQRQISEYWHRNPMPTDSAGCAFGHYVDTTVVIDSVPFLAPDCPPNQFGVFGFVPPDFPYSPEQIGAGMVKYLEMRSDVTFIGIKYGHPNEAVWWVYRRRQFRPTDSRPGGP